MSMLLVGPVEGGRVDLRLEEGESSTRCLMTACRLAEHELATTRQLLCGEEPARLARAAHPRRRLSFLRGRAAAKNALAGLCDDRHARSSFEIAAGVFDQPLVRGPVPNLGISLSHTDALAVAVAFPDSHPIGIDVERVDPAHAAVLGEQCSAAERARLHALGVGGIAALTLLWSAKEALSKVLRGGLACEFKALEVAEAGWLDGCIDLRFAAFAHLRAEVVLGTRHVLALVLPARCRAHWDRLAVREWIDSGAVDQARRA